MPVYLPQPEVAPSVAEQYYLSLINRDRADPAGAYDRLMAEATPGTLAALQYFGVSLSMLRDQLDDFAPTAPLAWNGALARSAETHSELIVQYDEQSHNLPGEPGLYQRILAAGYTDLRAIAENIYAYSDGPLHGHGAFMIDWGLGPGGMQSPAGHRIAILSGTYTEVGIGIVTDTDPATRVGTEIVTQHFGTTWNPAAQLLGVVIDDADGDAFYDPGEGLGGITVTATGASETYVTTSWAAGGYQMALPPGSYTVTFSGAGLDGTITEAVTIGNANLALDALAEDARPEAPPADPADPPPADDPAGLMLTGSGLDDYLVGGVTGDTLDGRGGGDRLEGGAGDDTLLGGAGFDRLDCGDGHDRAEGAGGSDTITGGAGDDWLMGNAGADTIEGGTGADTIAGGLGGDTLSGGDGADLLVGGINRDRLLGGEGDDRLEGGEGWDDLIGGTGADTLLGNAGNDTLSGGAGDDRLHGGIGADTFVFNTGDGADTIVAYQSGIDRIALDQSLISATGRLADHAAPEGGALVLDFGAGDRLIFDGLSDLSAVEGDILWL